MGAAQPKEVRERVAVLRELFRNLQAFRSLYESDGVDIITDPKGQTWSLWDLEYLIREGLPLLPVRQRQAILLCLVKNWREIDAAEAMGVSPTNPVSMYASSGIQKLLEMMDEGTLPRFKSGARSVLEVSA